MELTPRLHELARSLRVSVALETENQNHEESRFRTVRDRLRIAERRRMERSEFKEVQVYIGSDGLGYYTAIYHNGEKGPRSEGYTHGISGAAEAAGRDFPGIVIREVDVPAE